MYEFFNTLKRATTGLVAIPLFLYVKGIMLKELDKIFDFYRRNPTAVYGDHILVSILNGITLPTTDTLTDHYLKVKHISDKIASSLKMTNNSYKGHVFNEKYFFGEKTDEIIISVDFETDIKDIEKNWMNLEPVRVLHHEMTQLIPPILNGKTPLQIGGRTVIAIDIALLSVQYRAFIKSLSRTSTVQTLSLQQFIAMYPITNMCKSYLDYAIFNRLYNLQFGLPSANVVNTHSFGLVNIQERTDHCLKEFLKAVKNKEMDFATTLLELPAISKDNLALVMQLPRVGFNRQVVWVMEVARLRIVAFLLSIDAELKLTKNKGIKNDWFYSRKDWSNDKLFTQISNNGTYVDVIDYINDKIKPYL